MKIFRTLFNQSTININTLIKDANKTAWNKAKSSSAITSKSLKSRTITQEKTSFSKLIRNNKLFIFLIMFASSNLVYFFIPDHKTRPEILARNRLKKYE